MANSHFSSFSKKQATCLLVIFLLDFFFFLVVVSKCGGQKEIPIEVQSNPSPKRLLWHFR